MYIPDTELTMEYIQSLIDRCGFQNIIDEFPEDQYGSPVAYRDLNGNQVLCNLQAARDNLILAYIIQQNS